MWRNEPLPWIQDRPITGSWTGKPISDGEMSGWSKRRRTDSKCCSGPDEVLRSSICREEKKKMESGLTPGEEEPLSSTSKCIVGTRTRRDQTAADWKIRFVFQHTHTHIYSHVRSFFKTVSASFSQIWLRFNNLCKRQKSFFMEGLTWRTDRINRPILQELCWYVHLHHLRSVFFSFSCRDTNGEKSRPDFKKWKSSVGVLHSGWSCGFVSAAFWQHFLAGCQSEKIHCELTGRRVCGWMLCIPAASSCASEQHFEVPNT